MHLVVQYLPVCQNYLFVLRSVAECLVLFHTECIDFVFPLFTALDIASNFVT
jgi:hypothetical protein